MFNGSFDANDKLNGLVSVALNQCGDRPESLTTPDSRASSPTTPVSIPESPQPKEDSAYIGADPATNLDGSPRSKKPRLSSTNILISKENDQANKAEDKGTVAINEDDEMADPKKSPKSDDNLVKSKEVVVGNLEKNEEEDVGKSKSSNEDEGSNKDSSERKEETPDNKEDNIKGSKSSEDAENSVVTDESEDQATTHLASNRDELKETDNDESNANAGLSGN